MLISAPTTYIASQEENIEIVINICIGYISRILLYALLSVLVAVKQMYRILFGITQLGSSSALSSAFRQAVV